MSSHDIFSDAMDLVDKRVFKDGQAYPFIQAIEELAYKVFDWDTCISDIYYKYKNKFGTEISLDEFNSRMKKAFNRNGKLDKEKIAKFTLSGLSTVADIITLLGSFQ